MYVCLKGIPWPRSHAQVAQALGKKGTAMPGAALRDALRENGIEVTALHNHMLSDEPRLFFMHFWANDELGREIAGLRAALARVALAQN